MTKCLKQFIDFIKQKEVVSDMSLMNLKGESYVRERRRLETLEEFKRYLKRRSTFHLDPQVKAVSTMVQLKFPGFECVNYKEFWHVFKEWETCELCGKPLKRGFRRTFTYVWGGVTYVTGEAAHAKCVRQLYG